MRSSTASSRAPCCAGRWRRRWHVSPEHRQVIRLAHWGGMSLREIAELRRSARDRQEPRVLRAAQPAAHPGRDGGRAVSGCQTYGELLGGYVLGALDPAEEMAEMRLHIESCPRCAREERELVGLPALLDRVEPADVPPARAVPRARGARARSLRARAQGGIGAPAAQSSPPADPGRGSRRGRAGAGGAGRGAGAGGDDGALCARPARGQRDGRGQRPGQRHAGRHRRAAGGPPSPGSWRGLRAVVHRHERPLGQRRGTFKAARGRERRASLAAAVRPGDYHARS